MAKRKRRKDRKKKFLGMTVFQNIMVVLAIAFIAVIILGFTQGWLSIVINNAFAGNSLRE